MNYLIMGLAKSGIAATKLLLEKKEKVFAFDENKKIFLTSKLFQNSGVIIVKKLSEKILKQIDTIVVSPGIDLKKYDLLIKKYNIKIISEIELAYNNFSNQILAVTGTNGKTTTVNLLFSIIKKKEPTVQMVGNVGYPFSQAIIEKPFVQAVVCELSSFQLENIEKFRPQICGFLNIENDHLDRYNSFDEYFKAKLNVFKNFSNFNIAVLNFDDKKIMGATQNLDCKKLYFSLKELPPHLFGAYLCDDKIVFDLPNNSFNINTNFLKLKGRHNFYNIMCAGLMAISFGVYEEQIKEAVYSFVGLNHRLEFVEEINGISFYNDSKATNIAATKSAIECFSEDLILFLGGEDKEEDFNNLFFDLNKNVKKIIAFGKTKQQIYDCAIKNNFSNIVLAEDLKQAFECLNTKTQKEKIVLFSPACSSFDQFKNFEERGDYFKSLVEGLKNEI